MNSLKVGEMTSQAAAGVTYYNAAIVTENHLRSVTGRQTECKRLGNV